MITICTVLVEKSPQALPLGAACIASFLKPHFPTELIVFNIEDNDLSAQKIATALAKKQSKFYLFSVYVWNRKILTDAASILKRENPDSILIAGGPEVTANPQSFVADCTGDFCRMLATKIDEKRAFDFAVSGEGEKATLDLINSLVKGDLITQRIVYGKRSDLAMLPSPYLDGTLDASKYEGTLWELARGCPFKCSYCYESKGEKTVDYFPIKRLKAELDLFKKQKIAQIFVLDPTYNANKNRALEMLDYISKTAPEIFFHFECRSEFMDKNLAKAFSKINCSLQIGLQSANENVLRLVNRSFNKQEFIKKIALMNDYGLVFGFDLIYGLPGDNFAGFCQSIDFAISLYPNHLELFCLSVLPGTDLFDRAGELKLNFQSEPPYNVISTDKFSSDDLTKCRTLSDACTIFYSQGRAVPWFNSLMHFLKMKPTQFFMEFAEFERFRNKFAMMSDTDTATTSANATATTNANTMATSADTAVARDCHSELVSESPSFDQIEKMQVDFLKQLLIKRNQQKYFDLISDIVHLNAAISRKYEIGKATKLNLHYDRNALLSGYAQDIKWFYDNAKRLR